MSEPDYILHVGDTLDFFESLNDCINYIEAYDCHKGFAINSLGKIYSILASSNYVPDIAVMKSAIENEHLFKLLLIEFILRETTLQEDYNELLLTPVIQLIKKAIPFKT